MNFTTTENASSQQIVVAYTKLLSESDTSFIGQLVGLKIKSFEIEDLAETIKTYCCGQDQFSNLCLKLANSLHSLVEGDVAHSDRYIVRIFNTKLFSTRNDFESQLFLQQIWNKLSFPRNADDVVSFSYSIKLPGMKIDEIITQQGRKFTIEPQDRHDVSYSSTYIKEILDNLHKVFDVSIVWKDGTNDRTEKLQPYWNENTGKVELMPYVFTIVT